MCDKSSKINSLNMYQLLLFWLYNNPVVFQFIYQVLGNYTTSISATLENGRIAFRNCGNINFELERMICLNAFLNTPAIVS